MKAFVTFRLKDGVTPEQYLAWFHEKDVPLMRQSKTITSFRFWKREVVAEGEATWEWSEEIEFADQAAWEQEMESLPGMAELLAEWEAMVADPVVVFATEVEQG